MRLSAAPATKPLPANTTLQTGWSQTVIAAVSSSEGHFSKWT